MKIRLPLLTAFLAAAAVACHLSPSATAWLQFDRAELARGELWRLFTAHLTHFGANHLAWDVAVLFGLGTVCERHSRIRTAAALTLATVVITPVLWLVQPHFTLYRGLSGLDCALFGLLATSLFHYRRPLPTAVAVLALFGFAAKCVYELTTAQTFFAAGHDYAPVPLAHLLGLLAGCIAARLPVSRDATPAPDSVLSAVPRNHTPAIANSVSVFIRVRPWLKNLPLLLPPSASRRPRPSASACAESAKTTLRASISTSRSVATSPSPA